MDPFAVLGVRPGAPKEQVKEAYRKLARLWHPDKVDAQGRAGATKKMQEINRAYEIVMNGDVGSTSYTDARGRPSGDPFGFAGQQQWDDLMKKNPFNVDDDWINKMKEELNRYRYTDSWNSGTYTTKKKCPHCNGTGEIST